MTFITVAVITALCFVFASTRKYGVIGTGLLLYFQPHYTVLGLLIAGITYFYLHRKNIV
jgi:hypothetical protein